MAKATSSKTAKKEMQRNGEKDGTSGAVIDDIPPLGVRLALICRAIRRPRAGRLSDLCLQGFARTVQDFWDEADCTL